MNSIIKFLADNPKLAVCLGRMPHGALRIKMLDLTTGRFDANCAAVSQMIPWESVASVRDEAFDPIPDILDTMRRRLEREVKGHHDDTEETPRL
jgi:hypothetical protein